MSDYTKVTCPKCGARRGEPCKKYWVDGEPTKAVTVGTPINDMHRQHYVRKEKFYASNR